jgi:thiol-disulfide isomerase/thioredoxin
MNDQSAAKPKASWLTRVVWGAALFGVAAAVYIIVQASFQPKTQPSPAAAAGAKTFESKVVRPSAPTPAPDYVFYDEAGRAMKVADLKGKVVVLNIWATWCAPCKTEMPTLARLQQAYVGKPVEVVAISIDTPDDAAKAKLFIAQNGPLKFYHDRASKLPWALKPAALGAPTTIIFGADGMERARVAGEADWASGPARALVDEALISG